MSLKVGELYAALSLKKDAFSKGLSQSAAEARGWGSKVGGALKTVAKVAAVAFAGIVVGLVALGAGSLKNAEEQERANARVKAVFGDSADAVNEWAQSHSRALGVADDVLQQAQAKYATFATNSGQSLSEATANGQDLIVRAEEIARSTGQSFDEVFEKLMKGVQGSTRGLKEYGVQAGPTTIAAEALRMGLITQGEALDDNSRSLALQSLILQQTEGYTQSAADATMSMAFKQRQAGVMIDEIMDTVGAAFMELAIMVLPYVVEALGALATWVTANMPAIKATMAAVMNGIATVIRFVAETIIPMLGAAFGWLQANVFPMFAKAAAGVSGSGGVLDILGDAFDFITKTVIPALGAVFTWIRTNILPPVREIFNVFATQVLPALRQAFAGVQQWIKANWPTISVIVKMVGDAVRTAFQIIAAIIKAAMPIIIQIAKVVFPLLGTQATILLNVMKTVFTAIGAVWNAAMSIAKTVVSGIGNAWSGLTSRIRGIWNTIVSIIKRAINGVIGAINGFIRAINGVQIHIPGIDTPFGKVAQFDWGGVNLGYIPRLARGTRDWRGGLAMIGESGPEIVNLPRHSQVFPSGTGPGGGLVVNGPLLYVASLDGSNRSIDDISRRLADQVRLRVGASWGR